MISAATNMADHGPLIPQGLVLFVAGPTDAPQSPRRRRNTSFTQAVDRQGALVPLPETYEAALDVALRYFGSQLSVSTSEEIVLKRTVRTTHNFGSTVYAEFEASQWETVMVGPELELGVFKIPKAEPAADSKLDRDDDVYYGSVRAVSPPPMPFTAPINNPWLNNGFGYNNWYNTPAPSNPNKDKTIQLTHVLKTKAPKDNIPGVVDASAVETALVGLPETYEDLERAARDVFNPAVGSKLVMRVSLSPSTFADYDKLSSWSVVHKSAYATSILTYSGALEVRVDFEGGEDVTKSNAGSDTFLMV